MLSFLKSIDRFQVIQQILSPAVRRKLRIGKANSTIRIGPDSKEEIVDNKLQEQATEDSDWVKTLFLRFLALDIERSPSRLKPVTATLLNKIDALVGDEDIDLDEPLRPEDND